MLQTTARFFRALSMFASQTLTLPVVVTIRSILPSSALSMLASVPSLIPSMNGETSSKPSMHASLTQGLGRALAHATVADDQRLLAGQQVVGTTLDGVALRKVEVCETELP